MEQYFWIEKNRNFQYNYGWCLMSCIIGWIDTGYIYKNTFRQPLKKYFYHYALYSAVALIVIILSSNICNHITIDSLFLKIIINTLISSLTAISIYYLFFRKSEQYNQLMYYIMSVIRKWESRYLRNHWELTTEAYSKITLLHKF